MRHESTHSVRIVAINVAISVFRVLFLQLRRAFRQRFHIIDTLEFWALSLGLLAECVSVRLGCQQVHARSLTSNMPSVSADVKRMIMTNLRGIRQQAKWQFLALEQDCVWI